MSEVQHLEHSPLGASSSKRWMACPGSIGLGKMLEGDGEAADPKYRQEGKTAHAALAICLEFEKEPWELVGRKLEGAEVTTDMTDGITTFLELAVPLLDGADQVFIEQKRTSDLHPAMMGTVDFGVKKGTTLFIRDFKYGAGVKVYTRDNPQLLYYAYLLLEHPDCAAIDVVDLAIIQPRGFGDMDYSWTITAEYVREWGRNVLLPAMLRTEKDDSLQVGEHCRFCPARLVCPAQGALFEALIRAKPEDAYRLTDAALEQNYELVPVAKMYLKALEDEMMRRAMNGITFWKNKLVNKTADRVWKDGATAEFEATFGATAFTKPTLLSPAQAEKLGQEAKDLVKTWAYTPQTGFTLASRSSKKPEVTVPKVSETFAHVVQNEQEGV